MIFWILLHGLAWILTKGPEKAALALLIPRYATLVCVFVTYARISPRELNYTKNMPTNC